MKLLYKILMAAAASPLLFCAVSCTDEETPAAKAVLASENYLRFDAKGALPKTVSVYSDGFWRVEAPEWVKASQVSGEYNLEELLIAVEDNTDGQGVLAPRLDTLIIRGERLRSYARILISQDGDKYRGVPEMDIAAILKTADGTVVSLKEGQVMAKNQMGLLLSDGKAFLVVLGDFSFRPGDVLSLKGRKATEFGFPVLTEADEVVKKGASAPAYPVPEDISDRPDTYAPVPLQYVTVSGVCSIGEGGNFLLGNPDKEAQTAVAVIAPDKELHFGDLNGHRVTIQGYVAGKIGGHLGVIAVAVQDEGVYELIYLEDDFSWTDPWVVAMNIGDAVGTHEPSVPAPNLYTAPDAAGFLEEFARRGYVDLNPSPHVLYLQKHYLKFGKTSYNTGLRLPPCKFGPEPVDVLLSFDWCPQITGNRDKQDKCELVIEVEGKDGGFEGGDKLSPVISTTLAKDADDLFVLDWVHEEIKISGVTDGSRLCIRPKKIKIDPSAGDYKQQRWYLDNLRLVPAP